MNKFLQYNGEDVVGSTDDDNDLAQLTKFNQLALVYNRLMAV